MIGINDLIKTIPIFILLTFIIFSFWYIRKYSSFYNTKNKKPKKFKKIGRILYKYILTFNEEHYYESTSGINPEKLTELRKNLEKKEEK